MGKFELGIVMPNRQFGPDRTPAHWHDAFRSFREAGFTQLEIMFGPGTMEALEALAPVVEAIHAD
jgi:hypothetical protein